MSSPDPCCSDKNTHRGKELSTSDLMESGEAEVSNAAPQTGFPEAGVCTTMRKATLGIANSI